MTPHLKRSRIAKVLTDAVDADEDFDSAEERLRAVRVTIVVNSEVASTRAGQAAVLTAIAAAMKCFENATLVSEIDAALDHFPLGSSLHSASWALGAKTATGVPGDATHVIAIGDIADEQDAFVRCWWDGWSAGIIPPWEDTPLGDGANPLAGVFAGGLAVREVFASAIGRGRAGARVAVASLWEPWKHWQDASSGPSIATLPNSLWFVGLGHLGQGFLWALGFLPVEGGLAVLQDDQTVSEENEATGLLTTARDVELKNHKTRIAARWLEALGWKTSIIERRHYGDFKLSPRDPAVVLTSIDEPMARIDIAGAGYEYLIDAGVGHGPVDFETMQIRVLAKGADAKASWSTAGKAKDIDAVLTKPAYRAHAQKFDNCGTFPLAEASAAVPFVGAAVGALTMAQLLRLSAMDETRQIVQMELESPGMTSAGAINSAPSVALGGTEFRVASELQENSVSFSATAA